MGSAAQWNRLAIEHKQQGRWEDAIACYQQALALQPDFAEAHFNLGILWRDQQRIDQALACFERTLQLRPDVVQARFEIANLFFCMKDFDAAEDAYRRVLADNPGSIEALFNLGNVCLEKKEWLDAESIFREVLQTLPADANAWHNLGTALREQHRRSDAEAAYQESVRLDPQHAAAWTNLGSVYRDQGRLEEAASCHRRAITANPDLAEAYVNLGNAEHQLDRHHDALQAYQQAIRLSPDHQDAWLSVGHLLRELGDTDQAKQVYHALAARQSGDPLHALRRIATCPAVFSSHEELSEYKSDFLETAQQLQGLELNIDLDRLPFIAPECPFNLQFLDGNLRPMKEAFAQVYAPLLSRLSPTIVRKKTSKPHVGIVAITRWASSFVPPIGGVLKRLSRDLFDVTVFCRNEMGAEVQRGLNRDDFVIRGVSDRFAEVVEAIRGSACDLLYYWEIGNSPTNYFLPFLRLAPVQATSWGIQVTSGIPSVDAYLSSKWVESSQSSSHYTEKLACGESLLTFREPVTAPQQIDVRAKFGIAKSQHLYGCVQNLGKFHPDIDQLLSGILRGDPQGVVVVAEDRSGFAAAKLRQRLARSIPDVVERIVFTPNLKNVEYLQLIQACDVLLDPPHFGGVSTTYDAIALGKPLVTCPSDFQRGSYTAGLLRKIGVEDTIAANWDDYVQIAIKVASDRELQQHLGEKLLAAHADVFQVPEAVRDHERLFMQLLRQ